MPEQKSYQGFEPRQGWMTSYFHQQRYLKYYFIPFLQNTLEQPSIFLPNLLQKQKNNLNLTSLFYRKNSYLHLRLYQN